MSTFSGLNAATTALWSQRRALDVTGQNIANVNTDGYSRQRTDLQAIGGSVVPAFYSTSTGIGGGVSAEDVTRIRDAFLEGRGHTERANSARLAVESGAFELVEQAFGEPGDTGLQSLLSDMWGSWQDVANRPQDQAARGQVLQRLETVVGGLKFGNASLTAQWQATRDDLGVLVKDVNATASSVAALNKAIQQAVQSGRPANELADQRDVLVMKLAEQVGGSGRPGDDGMVDVVVGGMTLVAGTTATGFRVAGGTDPSSLHAVPPDPPRLVTASGGYAVRPGGTAGGRLSTLTSLIPNYLTALDGIAADLATKLNAQHEIGYDLDGQTDREVFRSADGGQITAASIELALTNWRQVAASAVGPVGVPSLDNSNAHAIARLAQAPDGTDAKYRQMITQLGVEAAVSQRNVDIQAVITAQVEGAREAAAGVNIDEEMTNMLSFQHAYAAAARLITAIDESLDVVINRMGILGR